MIVGTSLKLALAFNLLMLGLAREPVSLVTKERALLVIAAFEIVVTEKELRN